MHDESIFHEAYVLSVTDIMRGSMVMVVGGGGGSGGPGMVPPEIIVGEPLAVLLLLFA